MHLRVRLLRDRRPYLAQLRAILREDRLHHRWEELVDDDRLPPATHVDVHPEATETHFVDLQCARRRSALPCLVLTGLRDVPSAFSIVNVGMCEAELRMRENALYPSGLLGERGQGATQIAVAELALIDVLRLDGFDEQARLLVAPEVPRRARPRRGWYAIDVLLPNQ